MGDQIGDERAALHAQQMQTLQDDWARNDFVAQQWTQSSGGGVAHDYRSGSGSTPQRTWHVESRTSEEIEKAEKDELIEIFRGLGSDFLAFVIGIFLVVVIINTLRFFNIIDQPDKPLDPAHVEQIQKERRDRCAGSFGTDC